ncbi:hypothetical protein FLONG3_7004 [Fusarium longipes]|uniref:Heterokaryon incompatibility domain-containing protein n=1 Tax=Fusarium longipes TaxID=694270 RepID=A0A395SH24_9HYPO|nr:hypothetical protein FLONG3_7004 [Fusarium longipes]
MDKFVQKNLGESLFPPRDGAKDDFREAIGNDTHELVEEHQHNDRLSHSGARAQHLIERDVPRPAQSLGFSTRFASPHWVVQNNVNDAETSWMTELPDLQPTLCSNCQKIDFDPEVWLTAYRGRIEVYKDGFGSRFDQSYGSWSTSCGLCDYFRDCYDFETQGEYEGKDMNVMLRTLVDGEREGFPLLRSFDLFPTVDNSVWRALGKCNNILLCSKPPYAGGPFEGILPRMLNPDTVNMQLLRRWLTDCDSHHQECGTPPLPKAVKACMKLINCRTGQICSFQNIGIDTQYVTLSYVWGNPSANEDTAAKTLPKTVPPVIKDSIKVAEELGYQYIWVDRYCIGEDEGKQFQINNMDKIYRSSALTIIAAAGVGPSHGLAGVSAPRDPQHLARVGDHVIYRLAKPAKLVNNSTWATRGWTYQEGLLARRRLVFTEGYAYFQCQTQCTFESLGANISILSTTSQGQNSDVGTIQFFNLYGEIFPNLSQSEFSLPSSICNIIERFSARKLSFDDDAMRAIKGIMKHFEEGQSPVVFFCGLPLFEIPGCSIENVLALALTWSLNDRCSTSTDSFAIARREAFPSWTWAGWKPSSNVSPRDAGRSTVSLEELAIRLDKPHVYIKYTWWGAEIAWTCSGESDPEWTTSMKDTLQLSAQGKYPRQIRIRGWSFEVDIEEIYRKGGHYISFGHGAFEMAATDAALIHHAFTLLNPSTSEEQLPRRAKISAILLMCTEFSLTLSSALFVAPGKDSDTFEWVGSATITSTDEFESFVPPTPSRRKTGGKQAVAPWNIGELELLYREYVVR